MTEPIEETQPLGSIKDLGATGPEEQRSPEESAPQGTVPLDPARIRARRRPRAILLVWAWELACAFVIAMPIHAWARHTWGADTYGDGVLFPPGNRAVLAWLGEDGPALPIVVRTSLILFVLFAIVSQLITGALVASLATEKAGKEAPVSFALRAGAVAFLPMIGIGVAFGAIEGFVLGVGFFVSSAVDHALQASLGDARSFTARLLVFAVFVVLMLAIGVMGDLARVEIARGAAIDAPLASAARRMREGIVVALRAARQRLGQAMLAWGWRAALALALVYVGGVAGGLVGARGGVVLWGLFIVHQTIVLMRAGLRASWLANALRIVQR
jgi:hypothetical protein